MSSAYTITGAQRREVIAFIAQYYDKRDALYEIRSLKGRETILPGNGYAGDPVGDAAAKSEKLSREIGLIEDAARDELGKHWRSLVDNIALGITYEMMAQELPYSRRGFFYRKKRFIWRVSCARG